MQVIHQMRDNNGKQLFCITGKAIYSQKEAFSQLNHFRKWKKINNKAKKPIRAYRCPQCHEWHLTSGKNIGGKITNAQQNNRRKKSGCH